MDKIKNKGYSESKSKPHDHEKKNLMKLESNSEKSKVISKLHLPEDLVIGSSNFAELYGRCARSKPGLLVENMLTMSYYFLDINDDLNGHSERIDLGTYRGMGKLRSTCDGILLFWDYPERIFVVNPILKCCLRVPPLPTQESLTIDSLTIARVPRSFIFKLFFVDIRKASGVDWFVFYVLKIGIDNSWKEIATRQKVLSEHYFFIKLVYSGDNDLYWILKEAVIVMDVDKEVIVGEYPLPPLRVGRYQRVNFLWMGNHLSCIVHEDPTKTFQIYILDINSGKWSLYHEMVLFGYVLPCGLEVDDTTLICIPLWMKEQIIFQLFFSPREKLLTGLKKIHYGYNVKTRRLTKIEGIPEDAGEQQMKNSAQVDGMDDKAQVENLVPEDLKTNSPISSAQADDAADNNKEAYGELVDIDAKDADSGAVVDSFVSISDNSYTRNDILSMEKEILGVLGWYLTVPTPFHFLVPFIKAAAIPTDEILENLAYFLSELGMMHYDTLMYCPSLASASAVFAARCTLDRTPFWNEALKLQTGYSEEQLMDCARLLVRLHYTAVNGEHASVYQKYSSPHKRSVALIPPAEYLLPSIS